MKSRLLLFSALLFLGDCKFIEEKMRFVVIFLTEEEPQIDPCDQVSNVYGKDSHYIGGEYVDDDGNIDYRAWFERGSVENSDCDPVKKAKKNSSL